MKVMQVLDCYNSKFLYKGLISYFEFRSIKGSTSVNNRLEFALSQEILRDRHAKLLHVRKQDSCLA
jgi:hypothetical protein